MLSNHVYKKIINTLIIVSLPLLSNAQFHIPQWLTRYEMGFSLPMASANYHQTDTGYNLAGQKVDTSISVNTHSKFSFGACIGYYIPLTQLGQKSKLALDLGLTENAFIWDFKKPTFNGMSNGVWKMADSQTTGLSFVIGVPIGLSTKIGCDAMQDKAIRFCWSAGAGVLPAFGFTVLEDATAANFGVQPYLKMEAGVFGGICWKLRTLFSFGGFNYINNNFDKSISMSSSNSISEIKFKARTNFTVSIIIMPFSFGWKKSEWFNKGW